MMRRLVKARTQRRRRCYALGQLLRNRNGKARHGAEERERLNSKPVGRELL
jgi:hypothetical protein